MVDYDDLKRHYDDLSDNYNILQDKYGVVLKRNDELINWLMALSFATGLIKTGAEFRRCIHGGAFKDAIPKLAGELAAKVTIFGAALEKIAKGELLHDLCTGSCAAKHNDTSMSCEQCIAKQALGD